MPYQDMIIEAAGAALERTPDKQRIGRFSVRVLGSPAGEMKPEEAVPVSYDDKQLQLSLQQLETRALNKAGLIALGRAHDLLMQVSWANASLVATVRGATEPYDAKGIGHFSITGPDIGITSGAVIALAMTFNELCTNTTKFGALSVPTGRVAIAWTIDKETQRLRMTWIEIGGPPVQAPSRRSFGTRMMGSLGQQLNGKVELEYRPTGFVYTLDVPLNSLTIKA